MPLTRAYACNRSQNRSSVLVLTLLVLVLISIIVLGLLASVTLERQNTEANYQQRRALSLAMLAFQTGVSQIRDALGTGTNSWDDPYANFATYPPSFFWSVSPGIISRWSYTNATPTNFPLFSYTSDANNSSLVDLNRPLSDGSYPIIGLADAGGGSPPSLNVQCVNVLQDPTQAAGPNNRILGRYAFWIDDENAKININVADGSRQKYTDDWMKNSLGLGNPTEESLTVLSQNDANLTSAQASNIVATARSTTFHSPREILRVSGTAPDLYTNNVFSLTDDSKSPDINIFGQPKMAILPVLGELGTQEQTNMVVNGISLLPENEIYPTPSQLPSCTVLVPNGVSYPNIPWPLAFRSQNTQSAMGDYLGLDHDIYEFGSVGTYPYSNGSVIAQYLAGTNTAGRPITWPVFPVSGSLTTSTGGFLGKYTPRQLDEITIQIVNLGSKLISSDYPSVLQLDYPGFNVLGTQGMNEATLEGNIVSYGADVGSRFDNPPYYWQGWLSGQWVVGTGRTPKVSRLALTVKTWGSLGSAGGDTLFTGYTPPYAVMDIYLEEWIPGAFRGGTPEGLQASGWLPGWLSVPGGVNDGDNNQTPYGQQQPALLPKPVPDAVGNAQSWWANQLLSNNQGIDFNNNWGRYYYYVSGTNAAGVVQVSRGLSGASDPDQVLATNWHTPWAFFSDDGNPSDAYYHGAGYSQQGSFPPFQLNPLENTGEALEWTPGTMRCVQTAADINGDPPVPTKLYMQANAGGGALVISGGLQVLASTSRYAEGLGIPSDPDPTPLEAMRGVDNPYNPLYTADHIIDTSWLAASGMTGSSGDNVIARNIASVIPVALTNSPIPAANPSTNSGAVANEGPVSIVYITNSDPLVNKFPGDWHVSTTAPANFFDLGASPDANESYASYPEDSFRETLQDPDSYWIPQMDCPYTYQAGSASKPALASYTLIPRSARMPNIGYLQYIRTGIIPDDESVNYTNQQGTPFRLLSYAPLNDPAFPSSQKTTKSSSEPYPDWAMLDLFYVPSILYSFGGPYAGQTNLAFFGTYGGATAGRINPNGVVIYTTNVNSPQAGINRLLPLESTFSGLNVNEHFTNAANQGSWPYGNGTPVDAPTLAQAVADYIRMNGPLRMPSEICNIPTLANTPYRAPTNPTGSRNDLVRQMVGELTTQSNTFSVWTVGQVLQKVPGNRNYGEFETGDQITGEVRMHFVVERYLDPGSDGVYGNTSAAGVGADGVTNSFDDAMDTALHPFEPKYLYRVIRAEELR